MVRATLVPHRSEISKYLAAAHCYDAFEVSTGTDKRSALEIYIGIVTKTPDWVHSLMAIRNRAVTAFGLKNLGHLDNVDSSRKPESYRIGDRVGIFSILYLSDQEVILVESDKHLDAKISLCKINPDQGSSAVMTTVIHVHNLLGKAYMLLVWPVHKLIVPALLARSA